MPYKLNPFTGKFDYYRSAQTLPDQTLEKFDGNDCSGSSGAVNRVLTTSSASSARGEIQVIVGGRMLRKTDDYTVSGNDITFIKPVFNQHLIEVWYVA